MFLPWGENDFRHCILPSEVTLDFECTSYGHSCTLGFLYSDHHFSVRGVLSPLSLSVSLDYPYCFYE